MAMQKLEYMGYRLDQIPDIGLFHREDSGIGGTLFFWEPDESSFPEHYGVIKLPYLHKQTQKRLYVRTFHRLRVYLNGEIEVAIDAAYGATAEDSRPYIVVSASGYSNLSKPLLDFYRLEPGEWERKAATVFEAVVRTVQKTYPELRVVNGNGAVYRGVDMVQIDVARKLSLQMLQYNCLQWLWQVEDEDQVLYCGSTSDEYSAKYTENGDIFLILNGRGTTFTHDLDATMKYNKIVVPIDVIQLINNRVDDTGRVGNEIWNAVAAMRHSMMSLYISNSPDPVEAMTFYLSQIGLAVQRVLRKDKTRFTPEIANSALLRALGLSNLE